MTPPVAKDASPTANGKGHSPGVVFRPYRPEDLKTLALRAEQKGAARLFDLPAYAEQLAHPHLAQSALDGNGVLLGAAGVLPMGPGRGYAWALVAGAVPPAAWFSITREVRGVLAVAHAHGLRRIEAHVLGPFAAGHRWAAALGFVPNAVDELFDGKRDHVAYVRVFPPRAGPPDVDAGALARLAAHYAALSLAKTRASGEAPDGASLPSLAKRGFALSEGSGHDRA